MRIEQSHRVLTALIALAVSVRLAYAVWLALTVGADSLDNGDYTLYVYGAQRILTYGDFNDSLFLPRPPLFPLIVAALGVNTTAVLLANALVGGLTVGFVYALGQRLGLPRWAVIGGCVWFALDPTAIDKGAVLLDPVPWSVFGITGMAACLLALAQAKRPSQALGAAVVAAACFALAVLSRPESFLIWTGLGVWLLWTARRWWPMVLLYMGLCALPIAVWTFHNGQTFGHATYSTVSGFTMAFYRANSVERLATGKDVNTINLEITRRVEALLGNDPAAADEFTRFGYHSSTPEIARALNQVSFDIFRAYPLEYVATMGLGALRLYGLWPEGLQLSEGPRVLYNAALLGLALLGWGRLVARRQWQAAVWVFLVVGYYTVGVLLVKNAALEGRERAVLNPYLTLCAAYGLGWLAAQRARWSTLIAARIMGMSIMRP
ncbi:MAG: hypothetical protein SNJ54_12085 [Anaerolineae bacterium]